jgi:hypothetical protein
MFHLFKTVTSREKRPSKFQSFEKLSIGKALCDQGEKINLMPLSILRNIERVEVKPLSVTLGVGNKTIKHSYSGGRDGASRQAFNSVKLREIGDSKEY